MNFSEIWDILKNRGRVAHFYQMESEYLWNQLSPEQQQAVFDAITKKIASGRFVHFNPANAIRDNTPKVQQPKILSFNDYYKLFGTTESQPGWRKEYLPDQQKTIYVKS
ncbi:MAG: hypothetical protein J5601_00865 [Elusimicrobiaceae bacterium]|nr:hypothetical protein [Elusimicrobiaceae bacterium]